MLERDTGRPRGFGFLTFDDRRAMEEAIRDMHGRELGDRVISVNKAQPKMGGEDPQHRYDGSFSAGGRGGFGERDVSAGHDDCFKCGRPGHWARDCPTAGGGRGTQPFSPPRGRYSDRYPDDRERYMDDRYDRGHYGDRDRYDYSDDRYGSRDRYISERYAPAGDRFHADRYVPVADRYPPVRSGYGKDRSYDRDGPSRGIRYGGSAGPARSYRDRPAPYDRPRRGVHPPSLDRY